MQCRRDIRRCKEI